jgi:hypothetical protein
LLEAVEVAAVLLAVDDVDDELPHPAAPRTSSAAVAVAASVRPTAVRALTVRTTGCFIAALNEHVIGVHGGNPTPSRTSGR